MLRPATVQAGSAVAAGRLVRMLARPAGADPGSYGVTHNERVAKVARRATLDVGPATSVTGDCGTRSVGGRTPDRVAGAPVEDPPPP